MGHPPEPALPSAQILRCGWQGSGFDDFAGGDRDPEQDLVYGQGAGQRHWYLEEGLDEPMWIMANLDARQGLQIYFARMKIEETYRDLKSLLGMTRLMNKRQVYMEKMVALLLLVFTIGLLVGEELRDLLYGEPVAEDEPVNDQDRIPGDPTRKKGKKWKRYSGLFVLLKQKWSLTHDQMADVLLAAFTNFLALLLPHVRTFV